MLFLFFLKMENNKSKGVRYKVRDDRLVTRYSQIFFTNGLLLRTV